MRRQPRRNVRKCDMGRDMADAHVTVGEQHHGAANAGEFRQHLGMAGIMITGLVQRFLVERRGHDAADPS